MGVNIVDTTVRRPMEVDSSCRWEVKLHYRQSAAINQGVLTCAINKINVARK